MNTVKLTILFDGGCPLCKREINFLQSRDKIGNLNFVDINSSNSSFEYEYGISYKQAMERIHAVKSDGSIIRDVMVFQEAYSLIGLGWIYAPTKLPIIDSIIQYIYGLWAKNRLRITFRPSIEDLCSTRGCHL